ncbi:MAG: YhbY family RNA-binding protein [Gammaproteobacteria bacterium]
MVSYYTQHKHQNPTTLSKNSATAEQKHEQSDMSNQNNSMNKQRKAFLLKQSHSLNPAITVAGKGLSEGVQIELDAALKAHELIKIKFTGYKKAEIRAFTNTICAQFSAELVQLIGHVSILYRPKPLTKQAVSKAHKQSSQKKPLRARAKPQQHTTARTTKSVLKKTKTTHERFDTKTHKTARTRSDTTNKIRSNHTNANKSSANQSNVNKHHSSKRTTRPARRSTSTSNTTRQNIWR